MRIGSALACTGLVLLAAIASASSPAVAQGVSSEPVTPSRAYDQERLGAVGLQKCRAYKQVRAHSDAMQAADHGRLSPGDTRRLMAELARARRLPPARLTPADCGVPL